MDTRRVAVFVLAVLLPVPAQADRHTVECFTGLSLEKQQAMSARGSCGIQVPDLFFAAEPLPPPPPPPPAPIQQDNPVGDRGDWTPDLRAAQDPGAAPAKSAAVREVKKHAVFVVGELAQYVAGKDSGIRLDNWMVGLRLLFLGQKPVEPFIHVLGGGLRPSRAAAGADDAERVGTVAFGFGADVEISPSLHHGIVPVLRLQYDGVKPTGVKTYGRFTFGFSFRFEGSLR